MKREIEYELESCPFCDYVTELEIIGVTLNEGSNDYYNPEPTIYGKAVKCNHCGAQGSEKETEEEAVKAWNNQVNYPASEINYQNGMTKRKN